MQYGKIDAHEAEYLTIITILYCYIEYKSYSSFDRLKKKTDDFRMLTKFITDGDEVICLPVFWHRGWIHIFFIFHLDFQRLFFSL